MREPSLPFSFRFGALLTHSSDKLTSSRHIVGDDGGVMLPENVRQRPRGQVRHLLWINAVPRGLVEDGRHKLTELCRVLIVGPHGLLTFLHCSVVKIP